LDITLKVIPKPKPYTRVVLEPKLGEALPVITGSADLNLLCGNCSTVLVEGIKLAKCKTSSFIALFADISMRFPEPHKVKVKTSRTCFLLSKLLNSDALVWRTQLLCMRITFASVSFLREFFAFAGPSVCTLSSFYGKSRVYS